MGTSSIDVGFTYGFNRKIISRWRFLAGKINYNCWFSWEITYKYGNLMKFKRENHRLTGDFPLPSLTTLWGRFGCWWVEEFDLDTRVDLGLTNYCIGLITNLFIPTQMVIFPWWLDWFKGKFTGNHRFFQLNMGLYCRFSLKPIHSHDFPFNDGFNSVHQRFFGGSGPQGPRAPRIQGSTSPQRWRPRASTSTPWAAPDLGRVSTGEAPAAGRGTQRGLQTLGGIEAAPEIWGHFLGENHGKHGEKTGFE